MLIYPQQHIEIALLGFEHNAAVVLVDAHRMHIGAAGIVNLFVVKPLTGGVITKLGKELHHLFLLCFGDLGK
ncbi:hypothetical protein D3C85_1440850 [compost metagenome]